MNLRVSASEAAARLSARIMIGEELRHAFPVRDEVELRAAEKRFRSWNEYNRSLTDRLFVGGRISGEYRNSVRRRPTRAGAWQSSARILGEKLDDGVRYLSTLMERLALFESPAPQASETVIPRAQSRKVFLAHSGSSSFDEEVTRLLERPHLEVVTLRDWPDEQSTMLDQLEAQRADVRFAVVFLTSDELEGLAADAPAGGPAPRRAIFQLGYFTGLLGRSSVVAVLQTGLNQPSDIYGVPCLRFASGAWRLQLVLELSRQFPHPELDQLSVPG